MEPSENHPTTAKRETVASISRRTGAHRSTLEAWRAEGVDLHNEAALQARLSRKRDAETSPTLAAAKLEKIKAETARIKFAHEVEQGKFVAGHLVEGDGQRIGFAVRSALDQLAMQLPPQLAGRTAAEILKTLRTEFRKVLDDLSHHDSHIKFDP
jgi:hypothetical protein